MTLSRRDEFIIAIIRSGIIKENDHTKYLRCACTIADALIKELDATEPKSGPSEKVGREFWVSRYTDDSDSLWREVENVEQEKKLIGFEVIKVREVL